jgi:hypothetical protein
MEDFLVHWFLLFKHYFVKARWIIHGLVKNVFSFGLLDKGQVAENFQKSVCGLLTVHISFSYF